MAVVAVLFCQICTALHSWVWTFCQSNTFPLHDLKHSTPPCSDTSFTFCVRVQMLPDLVATCRNHDFTDVVVLHEHRGEPDGMVVCHLPYGPTAYFGVYHTVAVSHSVYGRSWAGQGRCLDACMCAGSCSCLSKLAPAPSARQKVGQGASQDTVIVSVSVCQCLCTRLHIHTQPHTDDLQMAVRVLNGLAAGVAA